MLQRFRLLFLFFVFFFDHVEHVFDCGPEFSLAKKLCELLVGAVLDLLGNILLNQWPNILDHFFLDCMGDSQAMVPFDKQNQVLKKLHLLLNVLHLY
jgi:hypothetical protein